MPLNLPDKLPAIDLLKEENIFVIDNSRASTQDIRPLKIVILNLMPLKITTETDLIRLLSNSPLQIEVSFMKLKSHTSKNTPIEHMKAFYCDFELMRNEKYDGMIITGAPVEHLEFAGMKFRISSTGPVRMSLLPSTSAGLPRPDCITITVFRNISWTRRCSVSSSIISAKGSSNCPSSADSTMCSLCRIAVIPKYVGKISRSIRNFRLFPSRTMARGGREFYVTGHSEYSPYTLDTEYRRDLDKGLPIDMPKNYYRDNDPEKGPLVRWRSVANLLFSNWMNYYVYQETPYDINLIK